jgi:MFS family permease
MLAIAFAPVALAFGILDLPDATPTTLSLVLAAESLAVVTFTLAGGVIADRYPRDRVLQAAEWVAALVHVSLGVMLLTRHAPTGALVAAAFVAGTGGALVWPALTGIIPEVVPPEALQDGNALLGLAGNISRIAGLVAGGIVVVAVGGGWALIAAGVTFGLSGFLVSRLHLGSSASQGAYPAADAEPATRHTVREDLRGGWEEFRSRQWLWVTVLQFSFLVMVWQAAHLVLGPVVARDELGGPGAWTTVLTAESFGLIIGGLLAMRVRPRRPILTVVTFSLGAAPPYLLLGGHASLPAVACASFFLGLSFELFTVIWQTTMQREIPPEALSRVSSFDALGSLLLGPLGLLLAGPAAQRFGAHPALTVCGVVMVVTSLAAMSAPGVRHLRTREGMPWTS